MYVSTDQTWDFSDVFTGQINANSASPLAEFANYGFSPTITIAPTAPLGDVYLIFVADGNSRQGESNEDNNYFATPITLSAPDLIVSSVTAPASAILGNSQSIEVSWTVENQGSVEALSTWSDSIYISEDEFFDFDDLFVSSYFQGSRAPLEAGADYTDTRTIVPPNLPSGNWFLLFVADSSNQQGETDNDNNVFAHPITFVTPDVDLIVSTASAPAVVVLGVNEPLSFTVLNQGSEAAQAPLLSDYLYLSDDDVLDENDRFLTSFTHNNGATLAGGGSYTTNVNYTLQEASVGAKYYLFVADGNDAQGETNNTNNYFAVPVLIAAPDLTVTTGSAPASATLNEEISISYTVKNVGSVPASADWFDAVYLSNDDQFSFDDELVDYFYQVDNSPLAPDDTYDVTTTVVIPNTQVGDRYLIFITDAFEYQGESNETNNFFATPIHLSEPDADLAITDVTAPATGVLGDTILISYTVENQGNFEAAAEWTDRLYLSDNLVLDAFDTFLTSVDASSYSPLAASDGYTITDLPVTLAGTTTGTRYLLVVTDAGHAQNETDESNNLVAVAIDLFAPDLTVSAASAPATVTVNGTFSISWTVENLGSVPAPANWRRLFLYF